MSDEARTWWIATARAVAVAAVAALILTGCAQRPTEAPPSPDAPAVEVVSQVAGFNRPWALAPTPDGAVLVTERAGTLAAIVGGTRQVVGAVPGVVALGEGGLMGLALHPDFTSNRRIFMCLAHGAGTTVSDVRVISAVVSADYSSVGTFTPLLTGIPAGSGDRHLGCRLAVGPDAMLWITTGDAARGIHPQDPTSRAGKVLRMTLQGAPAPGNPGGAWDPYVFTMGHRNPQGIAFRPSDREAFSVEHGPTCDDEVNLLTGGSNYGWAPTGGADGYGEDVPMTFPGAREAVWSTGCPTIAPSGATFINGSEWGVLDNQLVMAVLKGRQLRFVRMNGFSVIGTEVRLTDEGRLRAVQMTDDGSLLVAQDSSNGSILRVRPV